MTLRDSNNEAAREGRLKKERRRARQLDYDKARPAHKQVYNPRFKFEDIDADTSTERDRLERQSMRESDLEDLERGQLEFPDE